MSRTAATPTQPRPTTTPIFVSPEEQFVRGNRLISIDAVLSVVPTTRQTLYRWMEAGKFPKPIKLGDSKIGFRESEVIAWLNARPRALGGEDGANQLNHGRTRGTAVR